VYDIYEVLRLNGKLATIFAGAFPPNSKLVACLLKEEWMARFPMFGYSYKK
jgi:hypothetical protein